MVPGVRTRRDLAGKVAGLSTPALNLVARPVAERELEEHAEIEEGEAALDVVPAGIEGETQVGHMRERVDRQAVPIAATRVLGDSFVEADM